MQQKRAQRGARGAGIPAGMPAGSRRYMSWFVTATDTGVGKTLVSCALLHALAARTEPAVGIKPVAAGSEQAPDGRWVNDDVAALFTASSFAAPLSLVNPYCFREAIAPHIASHNYVVR